MFSAIDRNRNLECQLTKDYHRIEKGLALDNPKRPFGDLVGQRIMVGLSQPQTYSDIPLVASYAESALASLSIWNHKGDISSEVSPTWSSESTWSPILANEGQRVLNHFFSTRRSIRSYDRSRPVPLEDIRQAVATALSTPSVCNRQSWRVHLYSDPETIQRVISHQNGNAGFGHTVPALAVVTVDTRLFTGAGERHQKWIDGGLFAMSFVYALHARGLASCMLNWSMSNAASSRLRGDAGIDDHEDIVTLVAVGYTQGDYRVARSPRRSVDAVLVRH
jgi:nitroreductase